MGDMVPGYENGFGFITELRMIDSLLMSILKKFPAEIRLDKLIELL